MSDPQWYRDAFGTDYLDEMERLVTPEESQRQASRLITLLDLKPGHSVLDLCCGHGRHAIPLALQGVQVTGLDIQPLALERARRSAAEAGASVHWIEDDMRNIPDGAEFDAAYCMRYSFGFLESDEEDSRALAAVSRALKPGGLFLLQALPYETIIGGGVSNQTYSEQGDMLVLQTHAMDLLTCRWQLTRTYVHPDGRRWTTNQALRLYTVPEYRRMFSENGLDMVQVLGSFSGNPYSLGSGNLLLIGRKRSD